MKIKPIEKLQTEIAGYGFSYSLKKFYLTMALFFASVLVTGYLFKLHWQYIAILACTVLACVPFIILGQYKYLYEQKRFTDVSTYVEQMIYNFKKQPKILNALTDVRRLFNQSDNKMGTVLDAAIASIQKDGNGYETALNLIYESYPCSRVKSLHRFMIKIEKTGGSYQSGINVLLNDVGEWIKRTYKYQTDRKHSKTLILLSIILATVLCYAVIFFLTGDGISFADGIYMNPAFQISLTVYLCAMILIYTFSTSKLNGSWLAKENSDDEAIKKQYDYINTYDKSASRQKSLRKMIILIPFAMIAFYLTQNAMILILMILMIFMVYSQPQRRMKSATKYIEREVTKSFSDWMRDLLIEIPLTNVRVALKNTLMDSPFVLQRELAMLNHRIDEDPVTIEPYRKFFENYQLPEIKRPIQMLYSLNELGDDDVEKQLNDMINQSNTLIAKSEDMRNEDAVSLSNSIVAVPMLFSAGVLAVIMFLFFIVAIASMAGKVLGG